MYSQSSVYMYSFVRSFHSAYLRATRLSGTTQIVDGDKRTSKKSITRAHSNHYLIKGQNPRIVSYRIVSVIIVITARHST